MQDTVGFPQGTSAWTHLDSEVIINSEEPIKGALYYIFPYFYFFSNIFFVVMYGNVCVFVACRKDESAPFMMGTEITKDF